MWYLDKMLEEKKNIRKNSGNLNKEGTSANNNVSIVVLQLQHMIILM